MNRWLVAPAVLLCLAGPIRTPAEARVVRVTVERREGVLAGKPFGLAGAYERLVGTVEFALAPALRQNEAVVDLAFAPRNANGEVVFTADLYILKPVDLRHGNGRIYYEVPNRGGKGILRRLQNAASALEPREPSEFGDGWLMQQGFSLVWMGWQWDVPEGPGLLRLHAPGATDGGKPITGVVRSVILLDERKDQASLADREHAAYPAIDPGGRDSRLYVRDHRMDPPQLVPRKRWRFVDPTTVALDGGFEPGRIYEVVYRSRDPRVVGCSLAATRDLISFFKSEPGEANPLAGAKLALAHGISQSGRFLRHFLRQGFNEDESGRRVFDGMFIEVAGAGGGSFNHRFAQPSRDPHQHWNVHYPADAFPFTDAPETDPETGETAGLLDRATSSETAPKIFHVVTAYEYWNRAASLMHTDPSGTRDASLPGTSRLYVIASAQHGPGRVPPIAAGAAGNAGLYTTNPNEFRPVIRALVKALDEWVAEGVEPPASRYPRIGEGTLAPPEKAGWPAVPGVRFPTVRNEPARMDFGPEWPLGVVTVEPPRLGRAFPALVPAVDADGNDRAGIRLPEIEAPLGTQTGWNWRAPRTGAQDCLAPYIGSYLPFAWTKAEREASGDPRASVEERYRTRDEYLGRVSGAVLALVRERLLLPEDAPDVLGRALAHWDWRAAGR